MTKAYSKAAKRRLKRAMPKLAPTPQPTKRGKARMAEIDSENRKTNLEARARQMGLPTSRADDMREQMLGEQAGQALHILCKPDTAKRLWDHYKALTSAEWRFHRSIGKSIHPKTAKIEMMRERFEVDASSNMDLRSEEEKDTAAERRYMRWQGNIMRIHGHLQSAIFAAYRHNATLVIEGKATMAGMLFVEAMTEMDKRI